jgi:archaellin
MKRLSILLLAILFLVSCKINRIKTFQGKDNIYFPKKAVSGQPNLGIGGRFQNDTLAVSFGLSPNKQDSIIKIPVRVTGDIKDFDRSYKIRILNNATAKKGTDFKILNDNFVIKKGKYSDRVKIQLNNTSNFKNKPIHFTIKLLPNKDFKTNLKYKMVDEEKVGVTTFEVYQTNIIQKPIYWIPYYFGDYSVKKYLLIINHFDLDVVLPHHFYDYYSNFEYYAIQLQMYLDKKAAEGDPILDEDGSPMSMGGIAN